MRLTSQNISKGWVLGILTVSDLLVEWAWRVYVECLVMVSWFILTPTGSLTWMILLGIWEWRKMILLRKSSMETPSVEILSSMPTQKWKTYGTSPMLLLKGSRLLLRKKSMDATVVSDSVTK